MKATRFGKNGSICDGTSGDSTQLIFLRSRWYNPADGRFQSRDTWKGDANRPLSMNHWSYVESNPVNLTDPTGHKPFSLGYVEGYSEGGGIGQGNFGGEEIVYDYATMTRARFKYSGTVGGILTSVGWSVYVGGIIGFGYELDKVQSTQIRSDYEGWSTGFYIGGGPKELPHGIGVSVGGGYFQSQTSNVKGTFKYFSAGAGLVPLEIVGFESDYIIDPQSLPGDDSGVEFYADASGRVNRGKLISDILTGDHSPIGNLFGIAFGGQHRFSQIGAVLVAAAAFEEFHHQYELYYGCPRLIGPPDPHSDPLRDPFNIPLP